MDDSVSGQLVGSEIHGFRTLQELDVDTMRGEAKTRWLRPNEIHAILCNHRYFGIRVKPVHLPESGNIILFDRKMLRNFRKDGHNWKKKNDGKTVKEAHEHLKVGNEERIHVYYAHGQDSRTFVRRCYWLLDKSLEHIVLVHYRETKEGSPSTSTNSNSCSDFDHSPPLVVTEELDPEVVNAYGSAASEPLGAEGIESSSLRNHERRLYEINTLDWDELLGTLVINESIPHIGDKDFVPNQPCQLTLNGSHGIANPQAECMPLTEMTSLGSSSEQTALSISAQDNLAEGFSDQVLGGQLNSITESKDFSAVTVDESLATAVSGGLQNHDSFGRWIHSIVEDTPGSMHDPMLEPTIASVQDYPGSQTADHQQSHVPEHIFRITDVSPLWAYATEETKILVTGFFRQDSHHLAKSNMLCVCGDVSVPAELVQAGVYRCLVPQHSPGVVNFYLSIEGRKPISQVLNFEYRTPLSYEVAPAEDQYKWEEFETQLRLARLLFSTSKGLHVLSGKVSLNAVKEANKFARKTSSILNSWAYLMKLIENGRATFTQARDRLLEITLKNRLREWLLERIMEGCKTAEYDTSGQGVIHLCAILGYTWAVDLFSWSGLSLDFRDKHGWTALHWAAYCGREKMVAVLLTAGAKPNLVTDPTPENPGGCTAFDLAYMKGFDGLAAYLSEMALVSQFKDMVLAGNARGLLKTNTVDAVNPENISEDQLYMKDTLAAYRTAADAATRIQSAMRERAFKLRASALQFSNPEDEARHMVAAMKIQHAFRKYDAKKKMAAAAHIQYRYRAWKLRKEFLNLRRHAIRIQAAFRGFQTRRQYRKILWSVGIIDKAILRWRLKRRGFRGLQVNQVETMENERQQSDTVEEFFEIGQKQAEERVERAVVTVQSLFRSKKAQEEYTRMKLAHNQALLEYEGFLDPSVDTDP